MNDTRANSLIATIVVAHAKLESLSEHVPEQFKERFTNMLVDLEELGHDIHGELFPEDLEDEDEDEELDDV